MLRKKPLSSSHPCIKNASVAGTIGPMSARIRSIRAFARAACRICSATVKREDLPDLVPQSFSPVAAGVKEKSPGGALPPGAAINQLETEYRFALSRNFEYVGDKVPLRLTLSRNN